VRVAPALAMGAETAGRNGLGRNKELIRRRDRAGRACGAVITGCRGHGMVVGLLGVLKSGSRRDLPGCDQRDPEEYPAENASGFMLDDAHRPGVDGR